MFEKVMDHFVLHDDSEYEQHYADINWRTFRINPNIYERRYFPDLLRYTRELQHCYEELLNEMSDNYVCDADQLRDQLKSVYSELHKATMLNAKLSAEKEQMQIMCDFYKTRMLDLESKIDAKTEVKLMNGQLHDRRNEENRFTSKDGISKQDKIKMAAAYDFMGASIDQIAQELSIKSSTVRQYIATAANHFIVNRWHGEHIIQWDKSFGSDSWNLESFRLNEQQQEVKEA